MAGTTEEIVGSETLRLIGQKIVDSLKRTLSVKNINDTGDASSSLSYIVKNDVLTIEGLERVLFLEFGRRPGKFPDLDAIKEWVERKLNVAEEDVDTVAYLVGKKIQDEGTDILNNKTKGLQIDLTVANVLNQTLKEVSSKAAEAITGGLVTSWIQD